MTPRQSRIISELVTRGPCTAVSIANLLNLAGGEATARAELRELAEFGLVEQFKGRCRDPLWRVVPTPEQSPAAE